MDCLKPNPADGHNRQLRKEGKKARRAMRRKQKRQHKHY